MKDARRSLSVANAESARSVPEQFEAGDLLSVNYMDYLIANNITHNKKASTVACSLSLTSN